MKFFISLSAAALFTTAPVVAATPGVSALPYLVQTDVQHSGGCRKSSPAGQCCHAGSRPYHCH